MAGLIATMRSRRFGYYALGVGVLLLGLYPLYLAVLWTIGHHVPHPRTDFSAYWHAGLRLRLGYPLYEFSSNIPELATLPHPSNQYLYAPLVAVAFVPFSYLSLDVAVVVWLAVTGGAYLASVDYLVTGLLPDLERRYRALVLVLSLCFWPIKIVFYAGQVTPLLVASLCLSGGLLLRVPTDRSDYVVGAAAMVPAFVKPIYLPANAHSLRNGRRFIGSAVALGLFVIASLVVFGVQPHATFLDYVLSGGDGGVVSDFGPVAEWTNGAFAPYHVFRGWSWVMRALVVLTTVSLGLLSHYSRDEYVDRYVFVLGLITIPLATPVPDLLILSTQVPVLLVLLVTEWDRRDGLLIVPALALVLLQMHKLFIEVVTQLGPEILPHIDIVFAILPWIQPAVWGLLLVYALVAYRVLGSNGRLPDGIAPGSQ